MTKLYLFLAGLLLLSPGYAQTPHYIEKYGEGQEYEEEMEFRQGKTYKTEKEPQYCKRHLSSLGKKRAFYFKSLDRMPF